MQKFLITSMAFIIFAGFENHKSVIPVQPITINTDSSFIYIYRGGQFAGAFANFAIYVDNNKLCKLSNGKYFKVAVSKGVHEISAKRGGVGIGKKETVMEVDVENGKSYYVSCTMKQSITRVRLEMQEVMPKTGMRDISEMKIDHCQAEGGE